MLSCEQFARHVAIGEAALTGPLWWFGFWMHFLVCPFCRRYWRELRTLGAIHRLNTAFKNHPALVMGELKARLKTELRRRQA